MPVALSNAVTSTLRAFFEPRTIAVIGASRQPGTVGAAIFHNLACGGFRGQVVPVHPSAAAIDGVTAYPSIEQVPLDIDLAVVVVPATAVAGVIDGCIARRIPAILVISAGFGETGDEGRAREIALRDRVRAAGLRMIGPNCMGVLNTDPAVHLNASFSPVFPPGGSIAFSSQSGALGLAILEYARALNLGISAFVSVGNKADVSSNDLLEYWEADPRTQVILLYLESFGNPRRFSALARRVARGKPIVAVKSGRSASGARAASSHTGALASSDSVVDALFHDAGVIRTDTLEELFDVAALLAHQPLPAGRRVAILTNAGGPGILAADACEAHGLSLPPLSDDTVRALRSFLPPAASIGNPVDMLATAPADHFRRAIPLLLEDPSIDSLLTIFIPPLVTDTNDAARAIAEASHQSVKPVLATFFGAAGVPDLLAPVPCYVFPESAARALAHAVQYAAWRERPTGAPFTFDAVRRERLQRCLDDATSSESGWLTPASSRALLELAGIPTVGFRTADSEAAAVTLAQAIGFPVVLKGSGPGLVHKTEANAVRVNLFDAERVRIAYRDLAARSEVTEILLEPMIGGGVEMMVGGTLDATFGPVVVCGSGGTLVELMRDTVLRLAPLSDGSASEMLDQVRGVAQLRGFRGRPRLDEAALRQIVLRVGALLDACPGITELDLNPVIVRRNDAIAVDARVRIATGQARDRSVFVQDVTSAGRAAQHASGHERVHQCGADVRLESP
jgi:acetyl coenzyme A synthetase (ADP forming)-like protein